MEQSVFKHNILLIHVIDYDNFRSGVMFTWADEDVLKHLSADTAILLS